MKKKKKIRSTLLSTSLSLVLAACGSASADPEPPVADVGFDTSATSARERDHGGLTPVATANPKRVGVTSANVLSPELVEAAVAQGSTQLENPTDLITHYGYSGAGPMVPAPGDLPSATHSVEATKTEPDKNTYLVLHHQSGADAGYEYGTHFLFQGHENAARDANGVPQGYVTRINLDADDLHRVTLFGTHDNDGKPLPPFDGSTWDPVAQRLLFTFEGGASGGIWQATLDFPSRFEDISGAMGRGGYEGVQTDDDGNVWIVEDSGGASGTVNTHAKQPNSFVFRFVPRHKNDLTDGRLQALQVISLRTHTPIAFHAGHADDDILSPDVGDLHTYGKVFETRWLTIHDTRFDGTAPFDANALAKAFLATPFKRPENGLFQPGSGFRRFVFDETGDTNALTEAGSAFGGFGGVMELRQRDPSADTGTLRLLYRGDLDHTGFDNCAFWSRTGIVFVEDRGDGLHAQHDALDSAFLLDVDANYADATTQPIRIVAEGRDPSATIDAALAGKPGFQNDGDNEITGFHVSDGDPGRSGLLGARIPHVFHDGWRVFYTAQHGDNVTWEILPSRARD